MGENIRVYLMDEEWWPCINYERTAEAGGVKIPEEVLREYDRAKESMRAAFQKLESYRKEQE